MLPFYISEIEFKMTLMLIKLLTRIDDCGLKLLLTIQEINHIDDAVHPIHINVVNYGSLTDILFWNNQLSHLDLSNNTQLTKLKL